MNTLALKLENRVEAIPAALAAVETFAEKQGLPATFVMQTVVSLDEILTNVIGYGFEDDAIHHIEVDVACARGEITIEIIDDGKAFDPLSQPAPDLEADLEHREVRGLGIHLVRTLMDRVRYVRRDGRNHLSIAKATPAGA